MIVHKELVDLEMLNGGDVSEKRKQIFEVLNEIAYGQNFNPFKIMRNSEHEIRHSNIMAWLLDKKAKNHGFDSEFAVRMFSAVGNFNDKDLETKYSAANWKEKFSEVIYVDTEVAADPIFFREALNSNPEMKAEYDRINKINSKKSKRKKAADDTSESSDKKTDSRESSGKNKKIDILIIGETFTCTIENKFRSPEHDWQCQNYRYHIENKYKGKENYFVFLDTKEPPNWKEEQLRYAGYGLLTYESIIEILKSLIKDKEENDTIKFIKQYIDTLDEQYGRYAELLEKVIMENFNLTKDIIDLKQSDIGMTTRLLDARKTFLNYAINDVRDKNEALIKELLNTKNMIKPEAMDNITQGAQKNGEKLVEYHGGKASVTDPYGYKINIKVYNNGKKKTKVHAKGYLNEIDYVARYGYYNVNIYFNNYKNWLSYANENPDLLFTKYKELGNSGWNTKIEFNIKAGSGQTTTFKLVLDIEKSNYNTVLKYWKKIEAVSGEQKKSTLFDGTNVKENHLMFQMLKDNDLFFYEENGADYDTIVNYVKAYCGDKKKNRLVLEWIIALEYRINDEPITTDSKREELKKTLRTTYYEKTRDGLNLLELGDNFVEKIFKKPQD